ncbi:MAG: ribose-5-phosphate isomerase RpiA [Calditrichaeota bacterium]|nr:MAG: ribose-5-phosphate isomerase RpiA [Calditrichota bacterium]
MDLQQQKKWAAKEAVSFIEDGMVVGFGFGSTFEYALHFIKERQDAGLKITGVPATIKTAQMAHDLGIPIIENPAHITHLDLTIDGADEATPELNLIKGGGGALTREKIIASMSDQVIIIADSTKLKSHLGAFPLPVEVIPFGWKNAERLIRELNPAEINIRMVGESPFVTDNGNYILDCCFERIENPRILHDKLNAIPAVVDNGLFCGLCDLLLVSHADGTVQEIYG